MTAPEPTEFDDTGRLAQGAEFGSLGRAPLRGGATVDLRELPGMVGATDFLVGSIPAAAALGWSCVVNPGRRLAYRCFCLGTENAIGAFASGLGYSREVPEILGRPTTVEIPAQSTRRLCYGTALLELAPEVAEDLAGEGALRVEAEGSELLIVGSATSSRYPLDADFVRCRDLAPSLRS